MISFALVATYRVAQQHQAGSLQADLAKRGRAAFPAQSGERQIPIIETPGPHLAAPVAPTEVAPQRRAGRCDAGALNRARRADRGGTSTAGRNRRLPGRRSAGRSRRRPRPHAHVAAENPAQVDTRALQQRRKGQKARAARIARERKAAARRAAQARRAKQRETPAFGTNSFGGSFGGTFTAPAGR